MTLLQLFEKHYCSSGEARSFRVDDLTSADKGIDFCHLSVQLSQSDPSSFELTLSPVPWDESVKSLAEALDGEWSAALTGRSLTVRLTVSHIMIIRELAETIRKVVGRGRRYDNRNWKWVCPRTAASLHTLADHLMAYRRDRRALP